MASPSKAVKEFMAKYSIASDEIWEVHGSTWVVKHKALERVAVEVGVVWLRPSVQLCDPAAKTAVICAFGKLGDREEWSFGEASPANNKNSYPVAMAEKRARDRVILKLLVTHGALYSESEADEFEEPRRQNPHVTRPSDIVPATEYDQNGEVIDNIPAPSPESVKKLRVVDQRPIFAEMQKEIQATGSIAELQAWAATNKDRLGSLKPDWQDFLRGVFAEHRDAIRLLEQGDDNRMMANG
jgi:hypothetical protein